MKKTLFLFILIFIFSNNLFAQAPISSCDDHAEFYDPLKVTEGVYWDELDGKKAILDCQDSLKKFPNELRFLYQLARGYYKDEQYEKAYNYFLELADKKYPYAFLELGYMEYFENYGEFTDATVNWFLQASEFNIKDAYYYTGLSYFYLDKPIEAEKYLLLSLEDNRYDHSDKINIYFYLAENYQFWDYKNPNIEEAIKYYEIILNSNFNISQISEENVLTSYINLGYNYQYYKYDKKEAIKTYKLGIQFYENNLDKFEDITDAKDSVSNINYNIGTAYEELNENIKAVNYYNNSIEISPETSDAYNNLSIIYEFGEDGVQQDYKKAFDILIKGYELNPEFRDSALNLNNIAILYEDGKGTEQSFEKALEFYNLAIDLQENVSLLPYSNLSYLYKNGYGVTKNIDKAIELLIEAKTLYESANGNYYNFKGYEKDIDDAYNEILTEIESLQNLKNIPQDNEIVSEFNLADNCEWIADNLEQGLNQEAAFLQCLQLAEDNNPVAQYWIGYFYTYGYHVSQNYITAGNWFSRASKLGNASAKYQLINLILNGYYVNENINVQKYIEDLYNKNSYKYEAQYFRGLIFKYGIGVKADFDKSETYFEDIINNTDNDQLKLRSKSQLNEIISARSGFSFDKKIEEKFPKNFKGTFEWEEINTFNKYSEDWEVTFETINQIGPKRYQVSGFYMHGEYTADLNGYIDSTNNTIQLWESNPTYIDDKETEVGSWITKGSYLGFYDDNYETINSIWIPEKNTSKGYLRLENANKTNVEKLETNKNFDLNYGKYFAVVIGNDDYETEGIEDLDSAILDAEAVANLLESKYNFEVLPALINASRRDILSTLNSLKKKLGPYDNLLIYYAGHGYLDDANRGYWLPVDSNTIESEDNSQWISSDDISNILTLLPAKHILVVADSCYSGSLVIRGSDKSNVTNKNNQNYFKQLLEKKTRKALTSGALQPVLDGGGQGHSVFASAFLKLLSENDNILEGDQLSSALKKIVTNNAEQTPLYKVVPRTGDEGGDFIFVPNY